VKFYTDDEDVSQNKTPHKIPTPTPYSDKDLMNGDNLSKADDLAIRINESKGESQ